MRLFLFRSVRHYPRRHSYPEIGKRFAHPSQALQLVPLAPLCLKSSPPSPPTKQPFSSLATLFRKPSAKCRRPSKERWPLLAVGPLVRCMANEHVVLTKLTEVLFFLRTGKSSLTVQFVDGHFVDSYYPTIENTFSKMIRYKNQEFATEIIDTAGQVCWRLVVFLFPPASYCVGWLSFVTPAGS